MNVTDLKDMELSENDFALIIKGLDKIAGTYGSAAAEKIADGIMQELLRHHGSPYDKERFKSHMEKEKAEKENTNEDIAILKGKLLMFKRLLMQEGALKEVKDILK